MTQSSDKNGISFEEAKKISQIIQKKYPSYWTEYIEYSYSKPYVEVYRDIAGKDTKVMTIGATGNYYQINDINDKPLKNVNTFDDLLLAIGEVLNKDLNEPIISTENFENISNKLESVGFVYNNTDINNNWTWEHPNGGVFTLSIHGKMKFLSPNKKDLYDIDNINDFVQFWYADYLNKSILNPSGETYKTHDNAANSSLIKLNDHDTKILQKYGFNWMPSINHQYQDKDGNWVRFYDTGVAVYYDIDKNGSQQFNNIPDALNFIVSTFGDKNKPYIDKLKKVGFKEMGTSYVPISWETPDLKSVYFKSLTKEVLAVYDNGNVKYGASSDDTFVPYATFPDLKTTSEHFTKDDEEITLEDVLDKGPQNYMDAPKEFKGYFPYAPKLDPKSDSGSVKEHLDIMEYGFSYNHSSGIYTKNYGDAIKWEAIKIVYDNEAVLKYAIYFYADPTTNVRKYYASKDVIKILVWINTLGNYEGSPQDYSKNLFDYKNYPNTKKVMR